MQIDFLLLAERARHDADGTLAGVKDRPMTDPSALQAEFYQRLADAKDCPCCASDFVEWVIEVGVSIENTRGESTRQLRRDANRVLSIAYTWDALYAANDPAGMYLCSDLRREFP